MKKLIPFLALLPFLLPPSEASAQVEKRLSGGILLGVNYTTLTGLNQRADSLSQRRRGSAVVRPEYALGFRLALFGDYRLNSRFLLRPEVAYSSAGAILFWDLGTEQQGFDETWRLGYFDGSLFMGLSTSSGGTNLYTGPTFGKNLSAEAQFSDGGREELEDPVNAWDFRWSAGVQASRRTAVRGTMDKYITIVFDVRATFGLRNVFEDAVGPAADKNQIFTVGLGVTFS